MKLCKVRTRKGAWLLGVASLMPFGAMADPTFSWSNLASPSFEITAVNSSAPADVLGGGRASVFFSDGSSDQAFFVGSTSGLDSFAVAQTASFAIAAQSFGSLVSFPSFSISNRDTVRTLTGFRIDGRGDGAGHGAFDRGLGVTDTRSHSTPGSETGRDLLLYFTGRTFITGTVAVTYSNPLGLNGTAPVGDLFSTVEVQMNLGSGLVGLTPTALFSGVFSHINFSLDVDTVDYAAPVPVPGTLMMMLSGLGLLAGARRRRAP